MLLPPILLVGLDDAAAASLIALLRRIGLANPTLVCAQADAAPALLEGTASSRLPVVVLASRAASGGDGLGVIEWMRLQQDAIAAIDAILLVEDEDDGWRARAGELGVGTVATPVEMRALIAALKALALPEQARIDPATLTVHVELLRRGTVLTRQ